MKLYKIMEVQQELNPSTERVEISELVARPTRRGR